MSKIETDKLEAIMSCCTYEQQREIFIEECSEAIQAVQKCKRAAEHSAKVYEVANHCLISEVADVLIMAEQMRLYLGAATVDKEISAKLERQIRRLRGEENG